MECCGDTCCETREPVAVPVTSLVGLPVAQTRIEEKVTYTTKPMVAEKIIEVPQVEYRDHVVEDRQTVVMEKVIHVPRPEIQERIVEVPRHITREVIVDVPQVQVVEKFVEVPTPVFQEKIVPVARPVIKQKITHVPKPVIQEKIVDVPRVYYKPVTVEKVVEVLDYRIEYKYRDVPVPQKVFRYVPVERVQHAPQVRYVEKIVKKPEIRTHCVPVVQEVPTPPVQVASPRRIPVAAPATPVLVEQLPRQEGCCDAVMEGLFGCFMPPVPIDDDVPNCVSRRQLRLVSPRSPPVNMDVVVMPRNQNRRRKRGLCGDWCSTGVGARVQTPQSYYLSSPATVEEGSVPPAEPVFPPQVVHSPRSVAPAVSQMYPSPAAPMIQTNIGVMPFRQFEKLNNEYALRKGHRLLEPPTLTTQGGFSDSMDRTGSPTVDVEALGIRGFESAVRKTLGSESAESTSLGTPRAQTGSEDDAAALRRRQEELHLRLEHERLHAERLRLARLAEERRVQLLELREQQRLLRLQAERQKLAYDAQQELLKKEQHQLLEELRGQMNQMPVREVMVQTRYGPMKFSEFEKLNNEDAMKSPEGFLVGTQNTVSYSGFMVPPSAHASGLCRHSSASVGYADSNVVFPSQAPFTPAFPVLPAGPMLHTHHACLARSPVYRPAPVVLPPRVVEAGRRPVYLQRSQPVYASRTAPLVTVGPGSVVGVRPSAYKPQNDSLLDDRYKEEVVQLARQAAQNAYQAGLNVYEGVRSLVRGEV
ncbi:alveolin domain containing intermediate filament IMC14 [Besnoitia besnoiti]|uniref:Alveolin domain containing intermediate filament IMC14 n=1 Tax=Besnoitia besnoiti TaxID=94643 RepID=A0A2A9MD58_BESBE|nr:alveolin domain containing intermediate filament IMC14 [Besnoitia besnoiti]PFH33320.1 alveolin domain containing intermediate filament IMC14 [Besnoitia besnoiti]